MTERHQRLLAGGAVAVVLFAAYASTLAPDVTFWDSGEFIAAAKTLGIPHPPGTPLFVVALNAFARLLVFLPYAVRTNLFSAICTALAGGLSCVLVARATGDRVAGASAAVIAGTMSTVWQNANETEVYAASLLLSVAALLAAEWGGRTRSSRGVVLSAYLLALAVPLHLSALVAAPAIVYLASANRDEAKPDWPRLLALSGGVLLIAAAGLVMWPIAVAGALAILVGFFWRRRRAGETGGPTPELAVLGVVLIGLSATLILLVRARFDPAVNQANPSTIAQLGYTVARRQYEVAPIWPRQAPIWLQLANWFEYADWQFALALAPGAIPSVGRVLVTLVFATLGLVGSVVHRAIDRRTWIAFLLLFVGGSLGVVAYVNFKAGASFAWNIVPTSVKHEARDRDYFFVLGFWTWGLWAGMGAVALARRLVHSAKPALALAAVPLVLNWGPSRRNAWPEAGLPREVARALLDPLPARSVLFVAGDNDTYPLWFLQQVEGVRRDVTVVTIPLLGAPWYRDEMLRRWHLTTTLNARGLPGLLLDLVSASHSLGRPVAAALTVSAGDRSVLASRWRITGLVAVEDDTLSVGRSSTAPGGFLTIDTSATKAWAKSIDQWRAGGAAHTSTDPASEHFLAVLDCPRQLVAQKAETVTSVSLDSLCNLR